MSDAYHALRTAIETAYESRASLSPKSVPPELRRDIEACVELLDRGTLRVAQPEEGRWRVNEWLKKAVLLSFRNGFSCLPIL